MAVQPCRSRRLRTGRRLACASTLVVLFWPGIVFAQAGARVARIGFLVEPRVDDNMQTAVLEPFREELRKLGYKEGRNILLEVRSAEGVHSRLRGLAEELARGNPHV